MAKRSVTRQRDPDEVSRLRRVFDAQTVCNWVRFRRSENTDVPMPGEDGYSFAAHIEAIRMAIEDEGANRRDKATPFCQGADNPAEMFAATMRLACAMDPEIAEAYRPAQRRGPRRRTGAGPELVYSRD